MIDIIPITRSNLDIMARAAATYDMPRSVRWLERCLFDPTVADCVSDEIRGHMAVVDKNEVVAVQGYYYLPGYFKRKKVVLNSGCIMATNPRHAAELIICIEENAKTEVRFGLMSANCIANNKSAKICKMLNHMREAPAETRVQHFAFTDVTGYIVSLFCRVPKLPKLAKNLFWLLLRPCSRLFGVLRALTMPRFGFKIAGSRSFSTSQYQEFWNKYLMGNEGLIISRSPERMTWLFDQSIDAGTVSMLTAELDGQICGYVLVRKMPLRNGMWFGNCQIVDICALQNNGNCLKALVNAAINCANKMGGLCLYMYGALPGQSTWLHSILSHRRIENHPTFMCAIEDAEIEKSLQDTKGWFFGPMDGERCLGNGGYIDN